MAKKKDQGTVLDPWEQQNGEGAKAFEAFCIYRDLGPSRSLAKVAKRLGKSNTLIERWSAAYDWVNRCNAWDLEQDRVARQQQLDEIKKMRKRHAAVAQKALEKIAEALEMIDTTRMGSAGMASLMETASKLERISRGDVGDVIEERDGGQAIDPVQIYIPSNTREQKESFDDLEV